MNAENMSVEKTASTIETTLDTVETNAPSSEQEVVKEANREQEEQQEHKIFPCFCHSAMFLYRNK